MFDHLWYAPELVTGSGDPLELPPLLMATHHDASVMPLKQLLTLLIDHCFTFEQLRDMTLLQLVECVNQVNNGELSFTEKERIEKQSKSKRKT